MVTTAAAIAMLAAIIAATGPCAWLDFRHLQPDLLDPHQFERRSAPPEVDARHDAGCQSALHAETHSSATVRRAWLGPGLAGQLVGGPLGRYADRGAVEPVPGIWCRWGECARLGGHRKPLQFESVPDRVLCIRLGGVGPPAILTIRNLSTQGSSWQ
jgi:hypothetical protein